MTSLAASGPGSAAVGATVDPNGRRLLDDVLAARAVRVLFQPLVHLATGDVLGYEALARGPVGTPLESPVELFAAAYAAERVAELDWLCRAAALDGAHRAGLDPALALFVNSEPVTFGTTCPEGLSARIAEAAHGRLVVVEVTERALTRDPAGLLAALRATRDDGWGVALDDVGAHQASLALMPFVAPDVVKLDLRLVQDRTGPEVARIANAVRAHSERTGCAVLAEGIETPRHIEIARALGATLGQGYLFGRPGPLPTQTRPPRTALPLLPMPATAAAEDRTPWGVVAGGRRSERATKDLLLPMSKQLESKGLDPLEPAVVVACFQHARHFTARTAERFGRLAEVAAFVGAIGVGLADLPVPGVRGVSLPPGHPLVQEWDVVVVGPHFAGALVSRDLGDDGADPQRRFDVVITHDRDLVIRAGASLLATLAPTARPGP